MRLNSSVLGIAVLLCVVGGCSHRQNPMDPDVARSCEIMPPAWPIFQDIDEIMPQETEVAGFHDISLGSIGAGYNLVGPTPGKQYSVNSFSTAAVALARNVDDPYAPFKPVFRWLQGGADGTAGSMSVVQWVTKRDDLDPENAVDYRAPKCDAICVVWGGTRIVELAVCYQVLNIPQADIVEQLGIDFFELETFPFKTETNTGVDWDIGLTVLRWHEADFPEGAVERKDYIIPDDDNNDPLKNRQWPDVTPDLAYDHETGDLFIFYSDADLDQAKQFLKYVFFRRDTHLTGELEEACWAMGDGWFTDQYNSALWPLVVQTDTDHNGYTPSVDIGRLDFYTTINGLDWFWSENHKYVVVAYTSQFDSAHAGFDVVAGGWPITGGQAGEGYSLRTMQVLRNPTYASLNAGLPSIDVSPNTNARNFAAVVYVQQEGVDGYGPVMQVYEADLFGMGSIILADPDAFQPIYTLNYADGLYPSISIHSESSQIGPFHASITYMAQDAQSDTLHPAACRLGIDVHVNPQATPKVTSTHHFDWGPAAFDGSNTITGNYNISQIPFINPGVSTQILSFGAQYYWAAWCERIEMEPPPVTIYGTYGKTTN